MCGIFGFAGSPDRQLLGRMGAAIVHRGPDDAGAFETPSVSLGHRRLSIIDREGGHQPVANEDETVWLTQAQMAELFQTTPQNVTLHLKAIFAEGELAPPFAV